MKKLLLLLVSLPLLSFGQYFTTTQSVALSGTAGVVTIQQPATPTRITRFVGAFVSSTVATTFTLERNGTAATTTSLAISAVNPTEGTAQNVAFSSSNVGTGTVIGNYQIPANGSTVLDLSKVSFPAVGQGQNVTIRTNSITGTVALVILWQEL